MSRKKTGLKKRGVSSYFEDAILLNNQTYVDYLQRMKKICLSMFEWKNLPSSMDARFLEMCLYYKGQACLLYDDKYGYINTMCAGADYLNIYGVPSQFHCFTYGGLINYNRTLYTTDTTGEEKNQECILVMNNFERVPTCATIELFAMRLAEAQRTADINIKSLRTPVMIQTEKNQELTLRNIYAQYDGNSPLIIGDKNLVAPDSIKVLKTEAPFVARDLMDYKRDIWNEFLTFIGVSNLNEKRERLVTSEVDSNNELINLNLQALLVPRKKACEQFNEKFGLMGEKAIDVKVRSDLYNIVKQFESITDDYNYAKSEEETIERGTDV